MATKRSRSPIPATPEASDEDEEWLWASTKTAHADKKENKQHKPIAATPEAIDEEDNWPWATYRQLRACQEAGGISRKKENSDMGAMQRRQRQLIDRLLREREKDRIKKENALKRKESE